MASPPAPDPAPTPAAASSADGGGGALLERLRRRAAIRSRYTPEEELARGGMGAIVRVWDEDFRRHLAMKVVLGGATSAETGEHEPVDERALARFLEEAQVTGQLDHPGIVPVHELGLDDDGRVYFTMKLVKGRDLKQIFDLVFAGAEDWNETRALSVILKVCEAMAYAHAKGVVHRDLKPANVMVGGFGEVYVMDWGLARVLGRADGRDLRLRQAASTTLRSVRTERRDERESAPDSPLLTMDGAVVGTPSYMAPEQARGDTEKIGPRADVYSIGALLYHLLARRIPYVPEDGKVTNHTVLGLLLHGPPPAVTSLRADVPAELLAICEKAMARDPEGRYADTLALADDLRAYLENRVVRAYRTGAFAELTKWVRRNRALATTAACLALVLVGGSALYALSMSRKNADLERASKRVAEARDALAGANAALETKASELVDAKVVAESERDRVLSLADIQRLADVRAEAEELWPALPARIGALEEWLGRARALVARLPAHREHLARVRARIDAADAASVALAERLHAKLAPNGNAEVATAEGSVTVSPIEIDSTSGVEFRWLQQQLATLIGGLEELGDPDRGAIGAVEKRLTFARTVEERTISGADARARWAEATASIRDAAQCPAYAGLVLAPQLGLVPIGRDPDSRLWEFAHVASGGAPSRDAQGRLVLDAGSAIVLVLVPAGRFWMGAQAKDPQAQNHDPNAASNERPVHEVELAPFFLAKHEITQEQWKRFTGREPSYFPAGKSGPYPGSPMHPVEQIDWNESSTMLSHYGLALPTEAQWEYAARAGTSTPWWPGDDPRLLDGVANVGDGDALAAGVPWRPIDEWLHDGFVAHAPIGSYRANAFGLHDVHGNVWEWCRDTIADYGSSPRAGDGLRIGNGPTRVFRGGSFGDPALMARVSLRAQYTPELRNYILGARAARAIE